MKKILTIGPGLLQDVRLTFKTTQKLMPLALSAGCKNFSGIKHQGNFDWQLLITQQLTVREVLA